MLNQSPMMTMLPVVNVDRARQFYEKKLGLSPKSTRPDGTVVYEVQGSMLALYPRSEPTHADHTAVTFEVRDVEREVKDLEGRGVRFEDYDLPNLKTERHIARMGSETCAWFKDPEGNILCIHEESSTRH